jgi:sRNA-binding carbon storage regulator CsrA
MLVLGKRIGQGIELTLEDGRKIRVMLTSTAGSNIRVGIDAPRSIIIDRVNADGSLHIHGSHDDE